MKKSGLVIFCGGLLLILAAHARAGEKFMARMIVGSGPNSEGVQTIRIEIDGYSTPEELAQLRQRLDNEGYEPFMSHFRGLKKGVMRFMGSRGYNVTLHVAESIPSEKGRKILLFSERQAWDADTHQMTERGYLFMVIELELDAKGKGDGRVYHEAKIRLTGDELMALESFNSAPKILVGVHPVK